MAPFGADRCRFAYGSVCSTGPIAATTDDARTNVQDASTK